MPPLVWIRRLVIAAASVCGLRTVVRKRKQWKMQLDVVLMRFFRDLGRYKAIKRRRQGSKRSDDDDDNNNNNNNNNINNNNQPFSSNGLVSILLRRDDPLKDLLSVDAEAEDESNLPTYTLSELYEYGNGSGLGEGTINDDEDAVTQHGASKQILISILGRIYDVTKGSKFYGPGGTYQMFAGHDVTYALATGCRTDDCVDRLDYYHDNQSDDDDFGHGRGSEERGKETDSGDKSLPYRLSRKEQDEARRWLSFFHLHDNYPLVGKLDASNQFEILLDQFMEEINNASSMQQESQQSTGNSAEL